MASFKPNQAASRCAEPNRTPGSGERRAARPRERTWFRESEEQPCGGNGRPFGFPPKGLGAAGTIARPTATATSPGPARAFLAAPRRRKAHSTISTPRMMRQWPGKVQR